MTCHGGHFFSSVCRRQSVGLAAAFPKTCRVKRRSFPQDREYYQRAHHLSGACLPLSELPSECSEGTLKCNRTKRAAVEVFCCCCCFFNHISRKNGHHSVAMTLFLLRTLHGLQKPSLGSSGIHNRDRGQFWKQFLSQGHLSLRGIFKSTGKPSFCKYNQTSFLFFSIPETLYLYFQKVNT